MKNKYSRKNIKPSFAESYFRKRIRLYFRDKFFTREHPIGIYFADFAWKHKKKIIEIDSDAHLEKEYKARDKRKDKYIKEKGWKIMRIKWRDLKKNPQLYIKKADIFIGPLP